LKKIRFHPNVQNEVRSIEQTAALNVLRALHKYADSGEGDIRALSGEMKGLVRLRVGNYRVIFEETDESITVHRIRDRKQAYR
jgi:mRNA interferase RelE/StbE